MKPLHFKFPTKQQEFIWQKRRQEIPPSEIAKELDVSRAFVSKAQRIAEERIEKILLYTASSNRVGVRHISPRYGFAVGVGPANKSETYIVYSPTLGSQVWYSHEGDCRNCSEKSVCEEILQTLAVEWAVPVPKDLPPTDAVENLFNTLMRRLKWIE
jgi:hypothetical protein